jgi:hypothetical protein
MLASRSSAISRWPAAAVGIGLLAATLAGCFRESDENTPERANASPGQIVIEVELTDDSIEMPDKLAAGFVVFEVTNSGTVEHGFAIDGIDASLDSLAVDQFETMTVMLEPGKYTAFGPGDGDRDNGLQRSFTVTEAADASGAPLFDEGVEPGENDGAPSEDQPGDGS